MNASTCWRRSPASASTCADDRRGDRRRRRFATPRKLIGYAGLRRRSSSPGKLAHRSAVQGRVALLAVGGDRGRPMRLAADQPLEPPLSRLKDRTGKKPGQVRGRAQGPDRRLARPRPPPAVQAQPRPRRQSSCPGKLPLSSGRLTAPDGIEKPRQLPPTRCAAKRRRGSSTPRPQQPKEG